MNAQPSDLKESDLQLILPSNDYFYSASYDAEIIFAATKVAKTITNYII